MKYQIFAKSVLMVILSLFLSQVQAKGSVKGFYAIAYDMKTNKYLYTAYHRDYFENNRIVRRSTLYKNKKGKIGHRYVNFNNSKIAPNFSFKDIRRGYEQGVIIKKDNVLLYSKESKSAKKKKSFVKLKDNLVVDEGFDFFVMKNWSILMSGQKIIFKYAVPSQRDYYTFNIQKVGFMTIKGKKCLKIKLSVNSMVLKMFVDNIIVSYALDDKRPMSYHGISNISNLEGKSYKVNLYFNYK